MPPKKDDKKKGGSGPFVPKVVDATQYLRKVGYFLRSLQFSKSPPVFALSFCPVLAWFPDSVACFPLLSPCA